MTGNAWTGLRGGPPRHKMAMLFIRDALPTRLAGDGDASDIKPAERTFVPAGVADRARACHFSGRASPGPTRTTTLAEYPRATASDRSGAPMTATKDENRQPARESDHDTLIREHVLRASAGPRTSTG